MPLGNLPLWVLAGTARVFEYGGKKYELGNWYKADDRDTAASRYADAVLRHLSSIQSPGGPVTLDSAAALDDESGLPHIDHLICSLLMMRGLLVKFGALPQDPGQGKEPPK